MKLELTGHNLKIDFSCCDEGDNHIEILQTISTLVDQLKVHNDVYLAITSSDHNEQQDLEPEPDPLD